MRYLVTPTFSEKVTSAGGDVLTATGKALSRIDSMSKEDLLTAALAVKDSDPSIYTLNDRDARVFLTFGSDDEGEYALILDIVVLGNMVGIRPIPSNDPKNNIKIDPTRNMLIDPRRNMMIDPSRNMMIDPYRNMMIDPRRNMMIDIRRNMMVDPSRNLSIDPKRNFLLDPNRNSAWEGPILYDLKRNISGFIVRANEKMALLFTPSASLLFSVVQAGDKNFNLFARDGSWQGFLVNNGGEGYNQFDLQKRWVGFLVGDLEPGDE